MNDTQSASTKGNANGFSVVGIGASAGGLQVLQTLFRGLPVDTGVSFVIIMHLDPESESSLAEVLQSSTEMPVAQVTDAVDLEPNHVYVIPPDKRLEATDHRVALSEFEEPRGRRRPIDHFFRSLAVLHGDAVGIILSGGGTDGSVGIKSIKEAGGLVLVQDPKEAEYDGMPRSAIATGLADFVLPAADLAEHLLEIIHREMRFPGEPDGLGDEDERTLRQIMSHVRTRTGHDFFDYKRSTVLRRMQRRMHVNKSDSFAEYLERLRSNGEESKAFLKEMLIGVTNFFRDAEAFGVLEEQIIPKLFEDRSPDEPVRVWNVGCSTGEEVYSIAMLLKEHADTLDLAPDIQIFASDLDDGGLTMARECVYPRSIATDVSEERLRRFFEEQNAHYRVKRELRDLVVFASHSVLRDPPFSRLDLISCRNLLIYLERDVQQKVFDVLHYALRPGGFLFLGSAETADSGSELFHAVDSKHRLYQARERSGDAAYPPPMPNLDTRAKASEIEDAYVSIPPTSSEAGLHRQTLEDYAPPSVLVDDGHRIVHLSERVGRYMQPQGGTFSRDLTRIVRPELQGAVRAGLFRLFERDEPTVAERVYVQFNGRTTTVYLTVRGTPNHRDSERLALVIFDEAVFDDTEEDKAAEREDVPAVLRLQDELRHVRERLQITNEEFESTREELKAQNEELRSMNEEYKSAMEELETSKEELQSVNEELQTVNNELKNKVEELTRAHSDLENLMHATEIGTLFLDKHLHIKRYTPKAERFFNLQPTDRGRPIAHFKHTFNYEDLDTAARSVLEDLVPIDHEIQDADDRWYSVRLRPYRTVDDKIEGVVISFIDVTEMRRTQDELRRAKNFAEMIVNTAREGMIVLDSDLYVQTANDSFLDIFEVSREETEGVLVFDLGRSQWDIPELREMLDDILPQRKILNDFKVERHFERIGRRVMLLNGRQIEDEALILLVIEDVTDRVRAMEELKELNETLEDRVAERTRQVRDLASTLTMAEQAERRRIAQILHDDLQQNLYGIQMKMSLFRNDLRTTDNQTFTDTAGGIYAWISKAIEITRQLSVDLSPPVLKDEGLADALMWLQTQMDDKFGLKIDLHTPGSVYVADEDMAVLLFQIVRELLFNVVKHAGVDTARVEIDETDEDVRILVADEGVGFNLEKASEHAATEEGFGLFSVRERLNLFGGTMEIRTAPGEGTSVKVWARKERDNPAS